MKTNYKRALLMLGATVVLTLVPLQSGASQCSTAREQATGPTPTTEPS